MLPSALILSSKASIPVAESVRANLQYNFQVQLWNEGFFEAGNSARFVEDFLRKLLLYDIAVIVMSGDDVNVETQEGVVVERNVPRHNIVFECGACMSRLGPHRTFLLSPSDSKVVLPSYLEGINTFKYTADGTRDNNASRTGFACSSIRNLYDRLDESALHSDLPAKGLAFGYYENFLETLLVYLESTQEVKTMSGKTLTWTKRQGMKITIILPERAINRIEANNFLEDFGGINTILSVPKAPTSPRGPSVYVLDRERATDPLHIIDIPTTLSASKHVVDEIGQFWGRIAASREYARDLHRREFTSFERKIVDLKRANELVFNVELEFIPLSGARNILNP